MFLLLMFTPSNPLDQRKKNMFWGVANWCNTSHFANDFIHVDDRIPKVFTQLGRNSVEHSHF